MSEIINIIILLFFGYSFQFMDGIQMFSVLPLLLIVILCCIVLLHPNKKVLVFLYLLAALRYPEFLYFVPCTYYMWIDERQLRIEHTLFLLPYVLMATKHPYIILMACTLCLAYILKIRLIENEQLKYSYVRQRDASKELALLMEEKNKNLLVTQEQNIHIAILNERNRIAREIHDHVGHLLSSSLLQVGALQAINMQDNMKEPLNSLRETISKGMDHVRNSVHDLHDDAMDLKLVLEKLCREFTFCSINLEYDILHPFDNSTYYHILAIIKEALHNATKHSNATKISLILREQPAFYQLIIHDNGSQINMKNSGIGMYNMKERVEKMHGFFNLHTDDGFQIFITIPKEEI